MTISIVNPVVSTYIFSAILAVVFLISLRKTKDKTFFSNCLSQELKGFAILIILFSHVCYFLDINQHFLFPLGIMAGVGINLFLFLSGYGLTVTSMAKPLSIGKFYLKRLSKLYIPFWLVLIFFALLDFFILKINYGWPTLVSSFLGWFGHANLYTDINSPFWYFSYIVAYYLIYPLVFMKKAPWVSALIIFGLSYFAINSNPYVLRNVHGLWVSHLYAFPLGMIFAYLFTKFDIFKKFFDRLKKAPMWFYYPLVAGLIYFICYFAYHSGVGESLVLEERISLMVVGAILILFLIKKIDIKFLSITGMFSYEIYLLHWPIMYRYDFLFKYFPAWLAMALYVVVFIGLGWIMQKGIGLFGRKKVK